MKYLGLLLLAQSVFSSQTEYIVELTPDPNRRLKQGTGEMDLDWVTEILNQDTKNRALSKDNERDNTILSQFNFGDKLQGFVVRTTKKTIEAIKSDPRIQYAMEDLKIEIDRISRLWTFLKSWFFSMRGAWGIDRIDQRHLPLDRKVNVSSTNQGKGITIYIIDTGINHKHHDFGGRASLGPNFVDAKPSNDSYDKKGHGTHCAGIAASNSYGVARKANIVGIKVFGKDGLAPFSALINAYSWIYNNAEPGKSVVSLSLGAQLEPCITQFCPKRLQNLAVAAIVGNRNIPVVAAAGNSNSDACNVTPGGEPKAFTVGATDQDDLRASYSNWGPCVDIFAPGTNIRSTWKGLRYSTRVLSGTSMATPHVAGAFALLLSDKKYENVQDLYFELLRRATPDVVKDPRASTRSFLYVGP